MSANQQAHHSHTDPASIDPGYFLVASDTHIGRSPPRKGTSHFDDPEIQKAFNTARSKAKHLILNGDMFGLTRKYEEANASGDLEIYKEASDNAVQTLESWIKQKPDQQIHFILGNHENTAEFRAELDGIAQRHPQQFNWHPEAILLGDILFTHGDLQSRGLTDKTRPMNNDKTTLEYVYLQKDAASNAKEMSEPLTYRGELGDHFLAGRKVDPQELIHVLVNGKSELLTTAILDRAQHVMSGHTHVKYSGYEMDGKTYYNTGGTVDEHDKTVDDLGFITGKINEAGKASEIVNYKDFQEGKGQFQERLRTLSVRSADLNAGFGR